VPTSALPFVPYAEIGAHAIIGDCRTAALVASDGTIDWMCVPRFDGMPVFGAILDATRGGYFRFGPARAQIGQQAYEMHGAVVTTSWSDKASDLELTDAMVNPCDGPADSSGSCIVRRLRCLRGRAKCTYALEPRAGFAGRRGISHRIAAWTTRGVGSAFELRRGDEAWAVVSIDGDASSWSAARARRAMDEARAFWRRRLSAIRYDGAYADAVLRSALVLRLLTYAPTGAVVAAATSALPERLGGDRNYDYRFAWIRDVSIAVGVFARLGDDREASRFLDWLSGLEAPRGKPLQVCYGVAGERRLTQTKRTDIRGYRDSRPVLFGNRAYNQTQTGSLGYLADCVLSHLEAGGTWKPAYDDLMTRCAEHAHERWRDDDCGLWELPKPAPFTMSKVMCWVVLDRAVRVADRTGGAPARDRERWRRMAAVIHAEVLERGWSSRAHSFRQRYGHEGVDAALLLMPLMGFLRAEDRRVTSTIDRIRSSLMIDGFVYRFIPGETTGDDRPVGAFEGSFLPCLFWLASVHALAGRVAEARSTFERALSAAGGIGLFSEEYDPRSRQLLGNYPQLFSHAECARAALEIDAATARGEGCPAPLRPRLSRKV
jgi:GH15 family glucan-1,4-alpha-glucosidase